LSDQSSPHSQSRIIYGLQSRSLHHFDRPETVFWNTETEERYMDQVRERAQKKAREILEQALAEAEGIRNQAKEEGYRAGKQDAQEQVEVEKQRVVKFLDSLEHALVQAKEEVFSQHKDVLFQILRLAFEKSFGVMLEEHRFQALSALFEESVTQIHAQSVVTMYVCPEDTDHAQQILAQAKVDQPALPEIILRTAHDVAPGGVRLESGEGVIDNSISSRFEQVRNIFDGYVEP